MHGIENSWNATKKAIMAPRHRRRGGPRACAPARGRGSPRRRHSTGPNSRPPIARPVTRVGWECLRLKGKRSSTTSISSEKVERTQPKHRGAALAYGRLEQLGLGLGVEEREDAVNTRELRDLLHLFSRRSFCTCPCYSRYAQGKESHMSSAHEDPGGQKSAVRAFRCSLLGYRSGDEGIKP